MMNNNPVRFISFLLTSLLITKALPATCDVDSTSIDFGNYDVFSATTNLTTGTITITCDPISTPFTIELASGLYGTMIQRKMKAVSSNDTIRYNLYTDNSRSIIWGDGTGSTSTVQGISSNPIEVYASADSGQDITADNYSDTINITITF